MHKQKNLKLNEKGLVSITVTMVIMIVITLVVSSFALIVRREQRRALDRQLSSQAFYAAEVGISDATTALNGVGGNAIPANTDITNCTGAGSFDDIVPGISANINKTLSNNTEYTCVLIDQTPNKITFENVNPGDGPFVVPVKVQDPSGINKLHITWNSLNEDDNFADPLPPNYGLPNTAQGLSSPMLRVVILPGFNGGSLSAAQLSSGAHTMFLYPERSSSPNDSTTVNYVPNIGSNPTNPEQGRFVSGRCNAASTPRKCNVFIDMPGSNQEYFVVVQPLYKKASVDVIPLSSTDSPLETSGSQAVIDVTGKSADVLRRVQVRVPIGDGARVRNLLGILPPGALASTEDICKKLESDGTNVTDNCQPGPPVIPLGGGAPTGGGAFFTNPPPVVTGPAPNPGTGIPNNEFDFRTYHVNRSGNPDSVVAGCRWDWGDGTYSLAAPGSSTLTDLQNNACLEGWSVRHVFPVTVSSLADLNDGDCRVYSLSLTVYFNNGWPPKRYPPTGYAYRNAPYGSIGGTTQGCRDDGNPSNNAPSGSDVVWKLYPPQPSTILCQINQPPCYQRRYAPVTP